MSVGNILMSKFKLKLKSQKNREVYQQYFTSVSTAYNMATIVSVDKRQKELWVLDPGAGSGVLGISLSLKLAELGHVKSVHLVGYEIDSELIETLSFNYDTLSRNNSKISTHIINGNFLKNNDIFNYDIVIMNPPYKKISSDTNLDKMLKEQEIDVPNVYAAFMLKAVKMLKNQGQIIAITPRSFTNGEYYLKFREEFLKEMSLEKVHLFKSREIFEDVLQESIITSSIKKKQSDSILISATESDDFESATEILLPKQHVISKSKRIISLAINKEEVAIAESMKKMPCKIQDLEISVSTGPLVDFREAREYKRDEREIFTVPYIFPEHFNKYSEIDWPKYPVKKTNYIVDDPKIHNKLRKIDKEKGYVLVKRFSSKEEFKRITAAVVSNVENYDYLGFDNKLNYYHKNKQGFNLNLAKGLCIYLNSSFVDSYFRQISGSTQVNVSDLTMIRYPDLDDLYELGDRFKEIISEDLIDVEVLKLHQKYNV